MCAVCAMLICCTTYTLCGLYGFLTFGAKTNPDILTNYDNNDILVNVARVCVLLILLTSFSIQAFCARNILLDVVAKLYRPADSEIRRRVFITLVWFLVVLGFALVVPNISVAIGVVSGVAALFIFVFPGLCLLRTVDLGQDLFAPRELFTVSVSVGYVMLGTFICGLVTVMALQQAVRFSRLNHHFHL